MRSDKLRGTTATCVPEACLLLLLLLLQRKEVLPGIDGLTSGPSRRFCLNTMSPQQNNDLHMVTQLIVVVTGEGGAPGY